MKPIECGQSMVETSILTASITIAVLGLWAICNEKIISFVDLILSIIASPLP